MNDFMTWDEVVSAEGGMVLSMPDCPRYYVGASGIIYLALKDNFLRRVPLHWSARGFLSFSVYDSDNKQRAKSKCVHRVVARLFLGDPQGAARIRFKDGNRANCSAGNLEWSPCLPKRDLYTKLTLEDARNIRQLHTDGYSLRMIAGHYAVSHETINLIVKNKMHKDAQP